MSRTMRITYVTTDPDESEPATTDVVFPDEMFETTTIAGKTTEMGPSIGQMRRALREHLGRDDVEIVRTAF